MSDTGLVSRRLRCAAHGFRSVRAWRAEKTRLRANLPTPVRRESIGGRMATLREQLDNIGCATEAYRHCRHHPGGDDARRANVRNFILYCISWPRQTLSVHTPRDAAYRPFREKDVQCDTAKKPARAYTRVV